MDEKVIEKVRSSLLHRNVLGLLGMMLPFISIFNGLFVRNKVHGWIVMIAEALLLLFFGFAWLVKGQFVLKNL